MDLLAIVMGWIVAVFMGIFAIVLLTFMVMGKIDLRHLISEENGHASLSRFQFLVFTFVIAMSLFLIIVSQNTPKFPDSIPPGIFALLGISGGSYVISKGIQTSKKSASKDQNEAESKG